MLLLYISQQNVVHVLNERWLLPAKMFEIFEVVLLIHVTIMSYQISDV